MSIALSLGASTINREHLYDSLSLAGGTIATDVEPAAKGKKVCGVFVDVSSKLQMQAWQGSLGRKV